MPAELMQSDVVFDDDYQYFYTSFQTDAVNDAEAELIVNLLTLPEGSTVLDAPCGYGRISTRLADRGFRVVGIDRNAAYLDRAATEANLAGLRIEYRRADLRELADTALFDGVVCWFSSFGYWDDRANHDLLRRFRRALRSGGRLVLDVANPALVLRSLGDGGAPHRRARRTGEDQMIDELRFDLLTNRLLVDRTVQRAGEARSFSWACRLYNLSELAGLLHRSGFDIVHTCGDDGAPLTVDSGRQLVVATAR